MNCEKCGNSVKLTDCYCQKCGADLRAQKGTSTDTSVFRNLNLSSYETSDTNQERVGLGIHLRKDVMTRQEYFRNSSDLYITKKIRAHKVLAWIYIISCAVSFIMVIVKAARATDFAKYWYDAGSGRDSALTDIGITTAIYLIVLGADIILCAIGLKTKHFGVHIPLALLTSNIYEYLFPRKLVGLAAVCWIISLVHVIILLVLSVKLTNSYTRYSAEMYARKG